MNKKTVKKEPGFFKYIVSLACTHRLKLPPAHHWNKQKIFPDKVILSDQSGNGWLVKVEKVGNQVCFVDGWLKFVKENNVKEGDFIVFENVSLNVYSFLLLDSKTTCETGGFMDPNPVSKDEDEEDDDSEEQSLGGFEVREKSEEDADEEVQEEEEDAEEEEDDTEEEEDEDAEDEEDDDYDLEEEEDINVWRGNISSRNRPESLRMRKSPGSSSSINYRTYNIYANDVFKSGGIPRPKNPYFVTRIRANRGDELYIPKNVVKDYNLCLPVKTIMRDIRGAEWATELNEWSDGRLWYYGGWGSFCRRNHIEETDDCVCEFVKEAGKGIILFVYKLDI